MIFQEEKAILAEAPGEAAEAALEEEALAASVAEVLGEAEPVDPGNLILYQNKKDGYY